MPTSVVRSPNSARAAGDNDERGAEGPAQINHARVEMSDVTHTLHATKRWQRAPQATMLHKQMAAQVYR